METILKDNEIESEIESEIEDELSEAESRDFASISVSPTSLTFSNAAGARSVAVTCADTGWNTSSSSPSWCNIIKNSNKMATITVTKNTGGKRITGCTCYNGSKAALVTVTQEGSAVTYDRSNMIMLLKQNTGDDNCAVVCAAMCVKKTLAELRAAGCNTSYAYWSTIGDAFGYTVPTGGAVSATKQKVFDVLKSGYPAIVKINDNTIGLREHWVVVTKYTGSESNLEYSNFTCADPISGTFVALEKATNFDQFYLYLYYKKN